MPLLTSTTTSPPVDSTSSAATHPAASASSSSTPSRCADSMIPCRAAARSAVPSVASIAIARTSSPPIGRRFAAGVPGHPVPASIRRANRDEEADWPQRPGSAWTSRRPVPRPHTGSLLSIGACLVDDPERGIELLLRPEPGLPWSDDAEAIHRLDRATLERDGLEPAEAHGRCWSAGSARSSRRDRARCSSPSTPPSTGCSSPTRSGGTWVGTRSGTARWTSRRCTSAATPTEVGRWSETARVRMLERYPVTLPHTHTALADAREQAALFREILDGARREGR